MLPFYLLSCTQTYWSRLWQWTPWCSWTRRSYTSASKCPGRRRKTRGERCYGPKYFPHYSTNIFLGLIITALNMAVRVSRVVMPIPTLPGTDSAGMNSDIQPRIWNISELIELSTTNNNFLFFVSMEQANNGFEIECMIKLTTNTVDGM